MTFRLLLLALIPCLALAAEPGEGTTRGVIDGKRPPDAVQLVGKSGHILVPESEVKCQWVFHDGVLTASPKWDSVITPEVYQDFRMHVEFNVNHVENAKDLEKNGNSGVYIQQRYELQILNSHGVAEEDYKASYCGSLYRQKMPDKIVCKSAGEWQSYDIVFRAARFKGNKKEESARISVLHNGELIHDDYALKNKTGAGKKEGPEPGPIKLQGHHNPVKFRNVWIQRLKLDAPAKEEPKKRKTYLDGSEELYDHREDPNEWNNLAGSDKMADVIATHRKHLPVSDAEILPGSSTGHKAYRAAGELLGQ